MKKTTIKTGLLALVLMLTAPLAQAQYADVAETIVSGYSSREQDLSKLPKMEKDIIILQNVLSDLFSSSSSSRSFFSTSRSAKGMYIPGNGVMFSMGNSSLTSAYIELIEAERLEAISLSGSASKSDDEEISVDELNKNMEEMLQSKSKEFLANYGSLLSELKSGEKLMLNIDYSLRQERNTSSRSGNRIAFVGSRSNKKRMQSSISYKTLNDFTTGKINLDQAMAAVETIVINDTENNMTDAKILAGILDDLLQTSMDGKFQRRGRTGWTYFEGFGLMFNIQMSSKVSNGFTVYSSQSIGTSVVRADQKDEEKEEIIKEIEAAYPEFENMLKENVIQYGRTLRSLGSDESVIVSVDFGSIYRSTELPRSIRMVVPKSSIDAYAKGQKSLDQVKQEIDITKLQSSTNGSSSGFGYSSDFFPAVYETVPEPVVPVRATGSAVKSKSNR